jgi:hypothetical protein
MPVTSQSFLFNETAGGSKSGQTIPLGAQAGAGAVPTVPASDITNLEPAATPITGVSMPAGGAGLTGWLSAIWSKLSGTLAVSGTFWQATQPVSAASLPLPTGAALETGGNLAAINTKLSATLSVSWSGQTVTLGAGSAAIGSITNTSFAATQATAANLNATVVGTGTFAVQAAQSGAWNIGSITTLPALVAGSAIIGKVGIDQTTPGTTNGVVINSSATVPTTETYVNITVNAQGVSGAPISVGTSTATILAASRTGRKEVTLVFESAVQARIGASNVTGSAYGALYGGVAQESITISGGAAIYGFGVGGTATISVIEVF